VPFCFILKVSSLDESSANSYCNITFVSVKPLLMSLKSLLIKINTNEKGANERDYPSFNFDALSTYHLPILWLVSKRCNVTT
jgi:hypothetical protein